MVGSEVTVTLLAADKELHAGLVALLGAVVATSVFTIGFVSHRSQAALVHARDRLRKPSPGDAEYAHDTVAHAQSYVVIVGNAVLAFLAVVAAIVAGVVSGTITGGDWVTLIGFCALEVAVVGFGAHDHARQRAAINVDLAPAGIALDGWRPALAAECRHEAPESVKLRSEPGLPTAPDRAGASSGTR
jgi:hypothetical protein